MIDRCVWSGQTRVWHAEAEVESYIRWNAHFPMANIPMWFVWCWPLLAMRGMRTWQTAASGNFGVDMPLQFLEMR